MKGTDEHPGVLPLAVKQIFDYIDKNTDRYVVRSRSTVEKRNEHSRSAARHSEFLVRVSYIEIYNEVISDLVATKPTTLRIHEDAVRGVFVGGLTEEIVTSAQQVLQFMQFGESRRHVSATRMNDQSSRSHTLFRILIESRVRGTNNASAADDDDAQSGANATASSNSNNNSSKNSSTRSASVRK
jgi:centromeric protein E